MPDRHRASLSAARTRVRVSLPLGFVARSRIACTEAADAESSEISVILKRLLRSPRLREPDRGSSENFAFAFSKKPGFGAPLSATRRRASVSPFGLPGRK